MKTSLFCLRCRSGQVILFIAGLLLTLLLSLGALADFTVNKTMSEAFQMFNSDGSPRTNCDLTKFSASTWKDNTRTALTWTFRNQSTGDYNATATPPSTGFYKAAIYYNNTAIGSFAENVRLYDVDTYYASSGPRFANISANLSGAAQTFGNITAGVSSLKSMVQNIPANPLLASDSRLNNLDAQVSSRASQTSLNNLPSASSIASTVWNNGARTLTSNAYVNSTSIDEYLSTKHGTGAWNAAGNVTVLPFQGAASYETVAQGKDVHVTRGDSVSIPYSIGKDLTGWTVWFGAKATPQDSAFALTPRDITASVTDPATGSGLISLSTADTDLPVRKYAAEVEIRNGTDVNTVLKFNLLIDAGVIN